MNRTVLFLATIAIPLWAGESLTFRDAVDRAGKNNLAIQSQQERVAQKKYDERTAKGNYLPTVSVSAQYTMIDRPITLDLDPIRTAMLTLDSKTNARITADSLIAVTGGQINPAILQQLEPQTYAALDAMVPHFIDTVKEQHYPSAALTVTQPIFVGGKIRAGLKAASSDLRGTKAETEKITNETIQQVYSQYFGIALLEKTVRVRKDVVAGMNRHKSMAEKLVATGLISRNNLLRAKVATADADRAFIEESCRLLLARASFANLIGSDNESFEIADSLVLPELSFDLDSLACIADSSQPIFTMIESKRSMAKAKVQAERSSFMPKIGAFGKVELFPDYLSSLDPKWAVGLNATMDIFSGTKTLSKTISAEHLVAECDLAEKSARQNIRLWIRKAQLDYQNAQARNLRTVSEIALGEENLRQVESRFANGLGTSLDVIDAQLILAKSRMDQLASEYDAGKAVMDLYTALGKSRELTSYYSN